MKKILIMIPILLSICFIFAQVTEYTFSQSTETYTEITGGSVLTTGTTDDAQYAVTPPFQFIFNGVPVTAMAVSTNGYVSFNAGTSSFSYAAISSATAGAGVVAPLSRDLRGGTLGEMRWEVFGEAPNRYVVFQWKNWKDYSGSASNSWNFQVMLYETTNNIAIRYGNFTWADTQTNSYQIGLRGATNAEYNNRTTTTDWSNTTQGLANNATCLLSTTIFPTPGLQFSYNYPQAVAAPNAPILTSPANGGYALTNATLNWMSGGGLPDNYDVYFGTTNPPTNLVANDVVATTFTPTLAPDTQYYWYVTAANAFGDGPASPVWSFRTPGADQLVESFEATTFPPVGWANGTTGNWTRSTATPLFHGLAHAYKFTSTSVIYNLSTPMLTIEDGSALDFWTRATNVSQVLRVVYSEDRTTWTQVGGDITYPATGVWYNHNVDLSSIAGRNYYLAFQTPTQTTTGSVYVDLVIGPNVAPVLPGVATQTAPADLAELVNPLTTFTWTAPTIGGIPTGYKVYCDTNPDPTTLIGTVTGLSYTATTPFAYSTMYYWKVVPFNSAGDAVDNVIRSFTTGPDPVVLNFPWTESFDGTQFAPYAWTNVRTAGTGTPGIWDRQTTGSSPTTAPYSGAAMARYNSFSLSGGTKGELVTPPLNIPEGSEYRVKFWMYRDSGYATYSNEVVNVYVNNAPTSTGATYLGTISRYYEFAPAEAVANAWYEYWFPFTGIAANQHVIFEAVSQYGNNIFMDHVTVELVPEVPAITVNPVEWDYGTKVINTTTSKSFSIQNSGGGTLDLSSVVVTGNYFALTEPFSPIGLGAGQSTSFTVNYAPTAVGEHTGLITITDGRAITTIDLFGECYDPTITVFPHVQDFETWPPLGWDLTGGTYSFTQYLDGTGNNWAMANYWGQSSGNTDIMTTPPLNPSAPVELSFKWSHLYSSSYPLDALTVQVSSDYTNWEDIWYKAGTEFNSNDGAGNTTPGTGVIATVPIPGAYIGSTFFVRFYGDSGYGPNVFIDDVTLAAATAEAPDAVTLNTPADASTGLPIGGFDLTWTPAATGGTPTSYTIYMSQDEGTIFDDLFFDATVAHFNPVTEGGLTFNYEDRWYWTVEAVNDFGSAVVDMPFWFEIQPEPQAINSFPWIENFDASTALPEGWAVADLDGAGTTWLGSAAQSHSAPNSFVHAYSAEVPTPGQNGWLITPAVAVPEGLNMVMSWWNYNVWPTYMVYNGVKVNTNPDPTDPNWVEIWSEDTATTAWSQAAANISAYGGQTVYFAFNYQGYDGDDWYIDDVKIEELLVDEMPPTITHLPLLNSIRPDVSYLVEAIIVDDATWNNPITNAQLWYTTNDADYTMVPMTQGVDNLWTAIIPAQPLDTTVIYYMEASDSEENWTNSPNFTFYVEDPTWIWYDTGGTGYTWFGAAQAFSPLVLFENPLFGTGNALQLNTVDGSAFDVAASTSVSATLRVYGWDGVGGLADFVDLTGPVPVVFNHQAYHTFDLSAYNLQITTPYFFVSYELPVNAAFLFDSTYHYGTTYVIINGAINTLTGTGQWAIGANIQTGMSLGIDAPMVSAAMNMSGEPVISWDPVAGAANYHVYGAADPYTDTWTLLGSTVDTSYTYTGTAMLQFFQVTADTDAPEPIRTVVGNASIAARDIQPSRIGSRIQTDIRR